ncbi:MAG TPA: hypothetical protein VNA89_09315 [Gemmatimonadaceae bacterium]|nr:hypothetical protein [Gemmatimonadaceae bacterium]
MTFLVQEAPQAPQPPQVPQDPQTSPTPRAPRSVIVEGDRVILSEEGQAPGEPVVMQVPDRMDPNLVFNRSPDFPFEAMVVSVVFFVMLALTAIGWPIARAMARRMDRKTFAARDDGDTRARLQRIEQAVEAVAIEVERISEGQRFTAKLLADAGLGDRVPVGRLPERAP